MANNILEFLKKLEESYPQLIMSDLEEGTLVRNSFGSTYYQIDNPHIDKTLGDFNPGQIPIQAIYRLFEKNQYPPIDTTRRIVPFSEVVKNKKGACLESSILAQLSAQRGRDSFLIKGLLQFKGEPALWHAYNIVFKDNIPYLVDTKNPISISPQFRPRILPISTINKEWELTVPNQDSDGRKYFLF